MKETFDIIEKNRDEKDLKFQSNLFYYHESLLDD